MVKRKFHAYLQRDLMDCGPSCLRMICKYYGKNFQIQRIRNLCEINKDGVSMLGISEAAKQLGFETKGNKLSLNEIQSLKLPCILHWRKNHFVVLYKISKKFFYIADPAKGLLKLERHEFLENWNNESEIENAYGVALVISPTQDFYIQTDDLDNGVDWNYLFKYLRRYKSFIFQLIIGLLIGTILQLFFPFITQAIVDVGIADKDLNFLYVILIAQAMLVISRMSVEFLRSWILLHVSTRINISILTDFLRKLMRLPISFFDTKMTGDIMQRINDQRRIESFLTGSALSTIFSLFNLLIFSTVLAYYNILIFTIFVVSSALYTIWILLFLKKRRELDHLRFDISSKNQSNIVQLISGMQEIKLNNCEQQKRWEWEALQVKLFKFSIKSLSIGQIQQAGILFINETKNIIITFIVAKLVIDGQLTLGSMLAIQYIVAQISAPVDQILSLLQQLQDTKISIERLNEVHQMDDEETLDADYATKLPEDTSIYIENLSFKYPGVGNEPVLKEVSLTIPEGKITAIVGMSGSGKTTILKLLLRYYANMKGTFKVGNSPISAIKPSYWRQQCGVVMQDGFIFSDSIAKNIAVSDEVVDKERLFKAIEIANITDMIENLPLGVETKIGSEGNGISQGQKQRILIARAVYKNPKYIFFDEATNALDSKNESLIMKNLETFFTGRTVVVVAHRLSTVKNADNIIVLDQGKVIEQGTHNALVEKNGVYYDLVRKQLELN